jgi:hypothetical protein
MGYGMGIVCFFAMVEMQDVSVACKPHNGEPIGKEVRIPPDGIRKEMLDIDFCCTDIN